MDPKELLEHARQAAGYAVCTVSEFPVGAALLCKDGRVFTGCNVESPSLIQSVCAERVALLKALSEGSRQFTHIAVSTPKSPGAAPCGTCRQMLHEFAPDIRVVLLKNGKPVQMKLKELLPHAFTLDERA